MAIIVACIILAMLLADIVLIWTVDSMQRYDFSWMVITVLGAFAGFCAAQLVLAVLNAALGDGSTPRRIIYTTFLLAVFTNVLIQFNLWYFPQLRWGDAVGVFLVPLLLFFLLQIPLLGIRSYFGWRIKSPWSAPIKLRRMSFTLAHLLGWPAFLAVPLCIWQAMNGPVGFELLIICFVAVSGYALLFVLLYLTLRVTIPLWKVIVGATLGSLVAIVAEMTMITLGRGPGQTLLWETLIALSVAHVTGGTVVLVCLLAARAFGFRLLKFGEDTLTITTG